MSEVYDLYVDTAGNYHYTDIETGHHVIRKSCGYYHEDSDGYGGLMHKKFVQDEVFDNGIIKGHMEFIKTNADRIRSMTDEELAMFLSHDAGWRFECETCKKPSRNKMKDSDCENCWRAWLKNEAKG